MDWGLFYDPNFDSELMIIMNDLCPLFFNAIKIYLIKHKATFTLVYNYSKYISWHKDIAFGV
jgi:hypothetical protein